MPSSGFASKVYWPPTEKRLANRILDPLSSPAIMSVKPEQYEARADVSADSDMLILVDQSDNEVGHMSKSSCHDGRGRLHRAFSILIFNDRGELLLQQRAPSKRLWPLYWSNSCCSHPRRAETMAAATRRRLREELGIACELSLLFKFQYAIPFAAVGAENELCSVFIGRSKAEPTIDRSEINAWKWIGPEALSADIAEHGAAMFTPWFMIEWSRVWHDHRAAVRALLA
jgi:isopentenyl-diphosphate delta-isomerase